MTSNLADSADTFRCEHVVRFPFVDGECSVSLGSGKATRLPRSIAETFDDLARFRTLSDHARRIGSLLGAPEETVNPLLDELVQKGALVSKRQLLACARKVGPAREAPPDLRVVAFVTGDPRDHLGRAVDSYLENARVHAARCAIVVVDDARSTEGRALCRARLEAIAARRRASISYAGIEQKERYGVLLAETASVPVEVVRFALGGAGLDPSVGANRNCHLLHAAGEAFVLSDDHVHAAFAAPPDDRGRLLALGPGDEVLRFFPNRDAVLARIRPRDTNLLALHAAWLGRSLGDVVRAASIDDAIDADGLSSSMMRHLAAGRGRVVMTSPGVYGEHRLDQWLHLLPTMARRALLSSESSYRLATHARELLRVVPRLTLEHAAPAAGSFALDNRVLLPPFVPFGQGEDVSAATLRATCPEHYSAKLPVAMYHAAPSRGAYPSDPSEHATSLGALLAALIGSIPLSAHDEPARRMRALGRALREVASLDAADFQARMSAACAPVDEARGDRVRALLGQVGTNAPWWTRDAIRLLGQIEARIARRAYSVPNELLRGREPGEAERRFKRCIERVADLFDAWPALVEAAALLRARGTRLAQPIRAGAPFERDATC